MPIETSVTHIADLEPLYPFGTDNRLQGDNHIRNIKTALVNDLPLTTPATATGIALLTAANAADARTALGVQEGIVGETKKIRTRTIPAKWLEEDGTAVLIATYSELATVIYCGDANNATADWGYKCTDDANPNGTRSTSGTFIKLPDARGRYDQAYESGLFWANTAGSNAEHTHGVTDPGHVHMQNANGKDQEWGATNPSAGLAGGAITAGTEVNAINTDSMVTGLTVNSSGTGSAPVPKSLFATSIIYAGV